MTGLANKFSETFEPFEAMVLKGPYIFTKGKDRGEGTSKGRSVAGL